MARKSLRRWVWLGGITGLLVIVGTLTGATAAIYQLAAGDSSNTAWYADNSAPQATAQPAASQPAPDLAARNAAASLSKAFREAANRVSPSVVMITNTPAVVQRMQERKHRQSDDEEEEDVPFGFKGTPFGDMFKNPEFRHFFKEFPSIPDMPGQGRIGAGSGVIVDSDGTILTNNHVVAGGGNITVRLTDGREFKAVDIKTDPKTDLAVLHIKDAGKLPAAKLGDSSKVEVGDWVLALGEPFGLEGTVTAGIVSAKGRGIGITAREDFIQTDAAINPGNSGGPLVNIDGEVIGINTAISSNTGGYQGVGFAIPIDLAKWVGGQLVKNGKVNRAYLGVAIQPVTQPLAEQFKVKVREGVLVTDIQPNTPAAKAELKSGDIIVEFAGKPVVNPRQLQGIVEMVRPGSTQKLAIIRDGKRMTLDVVCAEQPANYGLADNETPSAAGNGESSRFEKLGVQVENLTPQLAEKLGIKAEHGVVITDVQAGSPAAMVGLTSGVVITQVDRQPVKSVEEFRKAVENKPLEKGLLLLVQTPKGSRFLVIRVETK